MNWLTKPTIDSTFWFSVFITFYFFRFISWILFFLFITSSSLSSSFFCFPPFPLLLQWRVAAGARRLPVGPQHQQRHCVGPNQLPQGRGDPQHLPRGATARCPGSARLHLLRGPRLPVAVARQQPGPEDARGHGDFQQVHLQVCSQVSKNPWRGRFFVFVMFFKSRGRKEQNRKNKKRKWGRRGRSSQVREAVSSVKIQHECWGLDDSRRRPNSQVKVAEQRLNKT